MEVRESAPEFGEEPANLVLLERVAPLFGEEPTSAQVGWGRRIRTSDDGTKTRCLTAWPFPSEAIKSYIRFIQISN